MNDLCKTSSQFLLNGKCPESPSCKEVFGIMLGTEKNHRSVNKINRILQSSD